MSGAIRLGKVERALVEHFAAKEQARYALNGLHVKPLKGDGGVALEVTDGRVLATTTADIDTEERGVFAAAFGVPKESVIVPSDAIIKAVKDAHPKHPAGVLLATDGTAISIGYADRGGSKTVKSPTPTEGHFPNVDAVFPLHPPIAKFAFAPGVLRQVCNLAEAAGNRDSTTQIRLTFYGKMQAMGFEFDTGDGRTVKGLAMPVEYEDSFPEPRPVPEPKKEPMLEPKKAKGKTLRTFKSTNASANKVTAVVLGKNKKAKKKGGKK